MGEKLEMLNVEEEVVEKAKSACLDTRAELVYIWRASEHPGDKHLFVVLAKKKTPIYEDSPYVVWTFNSCENAGGLCYGKYDLTFPRALEECLKKIDR